MPACIPQKGILNSGELTSIRKAFKLQIPATQWLSHIASLCLFNGGNFTGLLEVFLEKRHLTGNNSATHNKTEFLQDIHL